MSEQRKRELLEAAERAMALWHARPLQERVEELKRIGILDEEGVLSERVPIACDGAVEWEASELDSCELARDPDYVSSRIVANTIGQALPTSGPGSTHLEEQVQRPLANEIGRAPPEGT